MANAVIEARLASQTTTPKLQDAPRLVGEEKPHGVPHFVPLYSVATRQLEADHAYSLEGAAWSTRPTR